MKTIFFVLYSILLTFSLSAQEPSSAKVNGQIQHTLDKYCTDCHSAKRQKGKIRLDNFTKLPDADKYEILNKIEEQVYLKFMPPEDEDLQPSDVERQTLLTAIKSHHEVVGSESSFRRKLHKPEYGNYVDHEKLFSGEYKHLKGFTYDRKWLISEYIFANKINRLMDTQGKIIGAAANQRVGNPFLLSDENAIQYYAHEPLNSGHLLTMLENAGPISEYIIDSTAHSWKTFPTMRNMLALKRKLNAIFLIREKFIRKNIHLICESIYKDKNEEYQPEYTPVTLTEKEKELCQEVRKKYEKATWERKSRSSTTHKEYFWYISRPSGSSLMHQAIAMFRNECKTEKELLYKVERHLYSMHRSEVTRKRFQIYFLKVGPFILDKLKAAKASSVRYTPLRDYRGINYMDKIIKTIKKHRTRGMTYGELINKCVNDWKSEIDMKLRNEPVPSDKLLTNLISECYRSLYERHPSSEEIKEDISLLRHYFKSLGKQPGISKYLQTLVISSEFIYRNEYGTGKADKYGRKKLSPQDASFALAYALTESAPDDKLQKAAREGRLTTKADYKREVLRMLKDRSRESYTDKMITNHHEIRMTTRAPVRKLRFFRDFFGYPGLLNIFKDEKRFGGSLKKHADRRLVAEADRWVDHVLNKDKNVFEELLTSDKFYYYHNGGNSYVKGQAEKLRQIYLKFKDKIQNIKTNKDLLKYKKFLKEVAIQGVSLKDLERNKNNTSSGSLKRFHEIMERVIRNYPKDEKYLFPSIYYGVGLNHWEGGPLLKGVDVIKYWGMNIRDPYSPVQPAKVPNRKGILTHPAWLTAHSQNQATDPVVRGKWIREKLLAGTVPDVPITVDAIIPEDPHKTLRQRLADATEVKECWKCHVYMNPLGNAFEIFDDFGRYRTEEPLEHPKNIIKNPKSKYAPIKYKTLPVNAKSYLKGTGNPKLDGEVEDAFDLIDRIAKSKRARQSIIRYAFRFFMGRNERLSDSKTLIDADEAYIESGGSFDAVIVSLLTSDSFMYRKEKPKE